MRIRITSFAEVLRRLIVLTTISQHLSESMLPTTFFRRTPVVDIDTLLMSRPGYIYPPSPSLVRKATPDCKATAYHLMYHTHQLPSPSPYPLLLTPHRVLATRLPPHARPFETAKLRRRGLAVLLSWILQTSLPTMACLLLCMIITGTTQLRRCTDSTRTLLGWTCVTGTATT